MEPIVVSEEERESYILLDKVKDAILLKNNKSATGGPNSGRTDQRNWRSGSTGYAQVMQHHLENHEVARTMDTSDFCTAAQDW